MSKENGSRGVDATADVAIIRVAMKPFEYAADFKYLENAAANECETLANASDGNEQASIAEGPPAGGVRKEGESGNSAETAA